MVKVGLAVVFIFSSSVTGNIILPRDIFKLIFADPPPSFIFVPFYRVWHYGKAFFDSHKLHKKCVITRASGV